MSSGVLVLQLLPSHEMNDCIGKSSVSAVIPAYNAAGFISGAIRSVLEQTIEIAEIIVVDDGSSDNTAEVAAQFPRTRVIQRSNGGQAAARNTGIHAASGEWIAFLDHDDSWHPQKTEIQMGCIAPDVGVIHSNWFDTIYFGKLWHRQAYITPSGAIVRKQALLEVGCFEESRALTGVEDLNLWLKIALTDWKFVRSRPVLYEWRHTGRNYSLNYLRMARAELVNVEVVGKSVSCHRVEVERLKQASRIEYAKDLIANERWDEAAQLLQECTPGLASRWLSLVGVLKANHLARANLVKWLQSVDRRYVSHICSGECSLPETKRKQCIESCRKPYYYPPEVV
jgi:glycosyltransferase involved in cell wall biosynthesis